jgi:proline iminopeptidase
MPLLITTDERTLSYEIRGTGELLICHPGGPGLSGAYLENLGGLDQSRALVLLNPRGTGGSDPPSSPDAYTLGDYVDDIELLREHIGLDRIDLLGHSHGSFVAVLYAARWPERLGRLVLVGTGTRFQAEQIQAMEAAMLEHAEEPWFEDAHAALEQEQAGRFADDHELGQLFARELPFYFARYGEREQAYVARVSKQPVHAAALRYFNEQEFLTFDLRPDLPRISAPTLVVAGEKDFMLGPAACQEVAEGIANAHLEVIEGVGHMAPWVEAPEVFASAVDSFLRAP